MKHFDDEVELQDKCYHIEMLRLWKETSPHVKISYCMVEVEQEMESPVCMFCQYNYLVIIFVIFIAEAWIDVDVRHLRHAHLA